MTTIIPRLPQKCIHRQSYINSIVHHLTLEDHHIFFYGQSGSGKTVLLSSLANNQSIYRHFNSEVYWISVGKVTSSLQLLEVIETFGRQFLIKNVIEDDIDPRNIEGWIKAIKHKSNQGRFILFLDDVWDQYVIDIFMLTGIRLVISSRLSNLSLCMTFQIIQITDLDDTESSELFTKYFPNMSDIITTQNMSHSSSLSKLINDISKCPLEISIIASLLQRHQSTEYYDKLYNERCELAEEEMKRTTIGIGLGEQYILTSTSLRHQSSTVTLPKSSNNKNKEEVIENDLMSAEKWSMLMRRVSLRVTFNLVMHHLTPDIATKYLLLGLLPRDSTIHISMLCTLWEVNIQIALHIAEHLKSYCLLQSVEYLHLARGSPFTTPCNESNKSSHANNTENLHYYFYLHPLQSDFLMSQITSFITERVNINISSSLAHTSDSTPWMDHLSIQQIKTSMHKLIAYVSTYSWNSNFILDNKSIHKVETVLWHSDTSTEDSTPIDNSSFQFTGSHLLIELPSKNYQYITKFIELQSSDHFGGLINVNVLDAFGSSINAFYDTYLSSYITSDKITNYVKYIQSVMYNIECVYSNINIDPNISMQYTSALLQWCEILLKYMCQDISCTHNDVCKYYYLYTILLHQLKSYKILHITYKHLYDIENALLGNTHSNILILLMKQIELNYILHQYSNVILLYQDVLEFIINKYGTKNLLSIKLLLRIGVLYGLQQKHDDCRIYVNSAVTISESFYGYSHFMTILCKVFMYSVQWSINKSIVDSELMQCVHSIKSVNNVITDSNIESNSSSQQESSETTIKAFVKYHYATQSLHLIDQDMSRVVDISSENSILQSNNSEDCGNTSERDIGDVGECTTGSDEEDNIFITNDACSNSSESDHIENSNKTPEIIEGDMTKTEHCDRSSHTVEEGTEMDSTVSASESTDTSIVQPNFCYDNDTRRDACINCNDNSNINSKGIEGPGCVFSIADFQKDYSCIFGGDASGSNENLLINGGCKYLFSVDFNSICWKHINLFRIMEYVTPLSPLIIDDIMIPEIEYMNTIVIDPSIHKNN